MPQNALFSFRTTEELGSLESLTDSRWRVSDYITLERDWLGRSWIRQKGLTWSHLCEVRSLWGPDSVAFHVQCWFEQPGRGPDRVVLSLRPASRADYFQLEIGSDGKWLDSHVRRPRVDVDYSWSSGARVVSQAFTEERIWRASIRVPFAPFSVPQPSLGEAWRFNVVRTIGDRENLEFLSWRPSFTQQPDPHVPSSFGVLVFLGSSR